MRKLYLLPQLPDVCDSSSGTTQPKTFQNLPFCEWERSLGFRGLVHLTPRWNRLSFRSLVSSSSDNNSNSLSPLIFVSNYRRYLSSQGKSIPASYSLHSSGSRNLDGQVQPPYRQLHNQERAIPFKLKNSRTRKSRVYWLDQTTKAKPQAAGESTRTTDTRNYVLEASENDWCQP